MVELITKDEEGTTAEVAQTLDELARAGARRMIGAALELEVEEYIQQMSKLRDEAGHALVVRNGKGQERTVTMGAGVVKIQAPRVNDKRPEKRFTSRILPPYMRRSPRLEDALPILYLRGLSTGDFAEALPVLLGPEAAGLSATTISRLISVWLSLRVVDTLVLYQLDRCGRYWHSRLRHEVRVVNRLMPSKEKPEAQS